jgi:hypothetical protein
MLLVKMLMRYLSDNVLQLQQFTAVGLNILLHLRMVLCL